MAETGSAKQVWRLTSRQASENGNHVLILEGRLGQSAARQLESAAAPLVSTGAAELVIDLSGVDYLSGASLKVLERLAARQEAHGGRLILRAPSPAVRFSLKLSGDALGKMAG